MFKINEYFDGNVKSIAFETGQGEATAGVMAPGDYTFGTSSKEVMTVTTGSMKVKLPGSDSWQEIKANDSFTVEANQKFDVKIESNCSYICLYK